MADYDYDVLVIGSGPGGYVAAIRAAQLGLKTACVEAARRWAAPASTSAASRPRRCSTRRNISDEAANGALAKHGVKLDRSSSILPAMHGQRKDAVKGLTGGIEFLFKKNKVDWLKGYGTFTGRHRRGRRARRIARRISSSPPGRRSPRFPASR
jgi:dihydrolipoamide dehydrogenase